MTKSDLPDYAFTEKPVIGLSLIIIGGSIDSYGDQIKGGVYYEVGKHKETGKVAILPTDKIFV